MSGKVICTSSSLSYLERRTSTQSQARLQKHQLVSVSHYRNNSGLSDMNQGQHGYGAPDLVPGEPHRQFGGRVEFDSYRQHQEPYGRGRMQGADTRVPTPGGRVYTTGQHYY